MSAPVALRSQNLIFAVALTLLHLDDNFECKLEPKTRSVLRLDRKKKGSSIRKDPLRIFKKIHRQAAEVSVRKHVGIGDPSVIHRGVRVLPGDSSSSLDLRFAKSNQLLTMFL
mmetsp:Transcript_31643/g.44066  ORF Transcript_31643/g.44066 Transcript_31643/m.44066 type:complete len:113 (+) Transcript_31643:164-502(+)